MMFGNANCGCETKNPHVRLLMTNFERFGELYGEIQTLVPPGCKRAQVRAQRTARLSAAVSDTMELQDTVGDEEAVLVVVDPQELPRTWASLDQLGEQIGEGTYRVTPEDAALEQSVTMEEEWGRR